MKYCEFCRKGLAENEVCTCEESKAYTKQQSKKRKRYLVGGIGIALIIVVAIVIMAIGTAADKIDPMNYTTVSFEGYNSNGVAKVEFDKDSLMKLKEEDFIEFIGKLWASSMYGSKKYLVDQMISSNKGFDNLKEMLSEFIYGKQELSLRWDKFLKEAIITMGGVSVKDVNPSTMESKKIRGLYFAGEVLDVDALTGGFNLQIAWSTGYLAGNCAAERRKNEL